MIHRIRIAHTLAIQAASRMYGDSDLKFGDKSTREAELSVAPCSEHTPFDAKIIVQALFYVRL